MMGQIDRCTRLAAIFGKLSDKISVRIIYTNGINGVCQNLTCRERFSQKPCDGNVETGGCNVAIPTSKIPHP